MDWFDLAIERDLAPHYSPEDGRSGATRAGKRRKSGGDFYLKLWEEH